MCLVWELVCLIVKMVCCEIRYLGSYVIGFLLLVYLLWFCCVVFV